uniref:Uncharacterized protein n=1 Tax=Romanomermis culicivorax TaxID=13658 RepID=A0A915KVD9_ROMCU
RILLILIQSLKLFTYFDGFIFFGLCIDYITNPTADKEWKKWDHRLLPSKVAAAAVAAQTRPTATIQWTTMQPEDVSIPTRRTFPPPPRNYQGAPEERQLQLQPQKQLLQQNETLCEQLPCAGDRGREMEASVE